MTTRPNHAEVKATIDTVPTHSARMQLRQELADLIGRLETADDDEKKKLEAQIDQLKRDAAIAADVSLWSNFSMILTGGIVAAYVFGIAIYLWGLGSPEYAEVAATRNVLVFTLILAMLGFGGLLIARPLFSTESGAAIQERFRLAREIFMVFAGIFGTIIGFYFGTATPTAADPPELGVPSFADRTVSVVVEGGRAPFTGRFKRTPTSDAVAMAVAGRTLSYSIDACPAEATITVIDGDNRDDVAEVDCPGEAGGRNEMVPANDSTANGVDENRTEPAGDASTANDPT